MGAKLGIYIDGRWRSLKSLAAEGKALDFLVVRRGVLKKLARPPRRSQIKAGPPLPFRKIRRPKVVYKGTDYDEPISKNRKRKLPLAEVEINNKYSKSSPVVSSQNKAYKCFPQTTLQKAYKSIPENHKNNVQEKGVVIKDCSEDEDFKLTEKEYKNIPIKDTKNGINKLQQTASKQQLSTNKKSNKNLKSALIISDDDDKVTVDSKENVEKENIPKEDCKINQQPSISKGSKKNIASPLKSSGSNVKLRNAEKLEKDNSKKKDLNKNAQPSTSKGLNQDLQSSSLTSLAKNNDNLRNAEKKLEKESSKRKDFNKKALPSTSKGISQDLQSSSLTSLTNKNDKLRNDVTKNGNDDDSAVDSESSGPCLELVVEPEDLEKMRKCLMDPIFKVDIDRFDNDESYRQRILYKLQPVVQVAYIKPGLHHQLSTSRAGKVANGSSLKKKAKYSTTTDNKRRRSPVRFRKSSVPAGREYSSLEDHAIVSWLSASRSREHAVNGNRVWRELQPHHVRLTGQDRSWHSLRNRYLRYILPALGKLALSPSHAQRLRAAAATGAIKGRKKRRASILNEPAVRTAHQRACVRPSIVPSDSESDGVLHHKVQRPSLRHKNTKVSPPSKKRRTEPQKDVPEDSSNDDEIHRKVQRPSLRHKNRRVSSSSKKQRTEPQKDVTEDSSNDDEAKLPKRTRSKRCRDSEHSDSDDAPLVLSRLRPRSLRLSNASGNDMSYDPSPASKKKRRRLFNP